MALNADATEKVISVQEMHAQITKRSAWPDSNNLG
jgi:hypothetical protein